MPRSERILLFSLGGALLTLALWFGAAGEEEPVVQAAPPGDVETTTAADYEAEYSAFIEALTTFRGGTREELTNLRRRAEHLARRHGRDDAPRVAAYYAELTPEELRIGLDDEDEFLLLWQRVRSHDGVDWSEELPVLRAELAEFAERVLPRGDFVPAGHALSLLTTLDVEWLESLAPDDPRLSVGIATAERHGEEARAVFERAGMQTPQLEVLLALGRLALLDGRLLGARELFEDCAELAVRSRRPVYRELALVLGIQLARQVADPALVQRLLEELASFRRPEDCWELSQHHALALIHRDEPEQAAAFLLAHRPEADDLNRWRFLMAIARLRAGDLEGTRRWIEALTPGGDPQEVTLLRAAHDLRLGETAAVLEALGVPEARAGFDRRARKDALVLIGEAHLLEGRPARTLEVLSRARELAEGWESRVDRELDLGTESASVLGEWLGLHAISVEARALLELDRPLEAAVLIERSHGLHWRDRRGGSATLDAQDLLAWAAHFEHGLLTWIIGADEGVVVHVAADGTAAGRRVATGRLALERGARRLRNALIDEDPPRVARLSEELLHTLLPEDWIAELRASDASADERALLLVHGPLEGLPFEALQLDDRPLDERLTLVALPHLPEQRPGTAAPEVAAWRLLGSPVDADGQWRLPGARAELVELSFTVPGARLAVGLEFDRDALLEALQSGHGLHVATHLTDGTGCADARFADVGLELSGGAALCASEIAELGTAAPLVVLVACSTAGGRAVDGRGLQGVARACLEGGARNLLVTLWPIRDEVGREFSLAFHAALTEGQSPSRAARSARRHLAESGVAAADWAPFRILGRD